MQTLAFTGNGKEYFKIWIVNILLTIVTLGLYYPWAKVRNNRYFYGNTSLEERSFDYHATGKQLLIGYLIGMVLLIIYIVISETFPLLWSLALLGVFLLFLPWIVWRSMQFNMRMTSFSNVRFGFQGSLAGAYINFLLFPILVFLFIFMIPIWLLYILPMISLMFIGSNFEYAELFLEAVPFLIILSFIIGTYLVFKMKQQNTKYLINGSRYGQGIFNTELTVGQFFVIFLKTLGVTILVTAITSVVVGGVLYLIYGLEYLENLLFNLQDPLYLNEHFSELMPIFVMLYLPLLLMTLVIAAYSLARQRTYIFANTTLDDTISFASPLRAKPLAWVLVSNLLLIIVTLGLATPWAKVRMAKLVIENTQVDTSIGLESYVTQKQAETSALAEQLGDAFDVDVGIGL